MGGTAPLKLLLDTHIWIWSLSGNTRLGRRARAEIARGKNELWLSPITVWELLVLAQRGRLKLDDEPHRWVIDALTRTSAQEAPLNVDIAIRSQQVMPAHADRVDRFLVATALIYDLTLVTADEALLAARACRVLANR
jgi:PIN domain nuclease of toxin-antitoxin system